MQTAYTLNSEQLKHIDIVERFWENIEYIFQEDLRWEFEKSFNGYYIFKAPSHIVEQVYYDTFFKSEEYLQALESKVFSNKWEKYIQERKRGEYYLLDARDYVWEIIRYYAQHPEQKFQMQYFWNLFWLLHDLGHVYLDHLYLKWSFKHKDEMDASVFAVIKLLLKNKFNETDIKREVFNAVHPLLKSWKYINKDDVKYFLLQMEYFKRYYKFS